MARPESLLDASAVSASREFAYADGHDREVRERPLGELRELHVSADTAVVLLEGSLALQAADHQLASVVVTCYNPGMSAG
jgi:hypothetical protein